jgi:hypothetical protein
MVVRPAALLLVSISALVASCKPGAFGASYDDCILKGTSTGQSSEGAAAVQRSCRRAWETKASLKADVTAELYLRDERSTIEFEIKNNTDSIATSAEITVAFANLAGKDPLAEENLDWTVPIFLEPGDSETVTATFGGKSPPSEIFRILEEKTKFTKIIPIVKAKS